MHCIYYNLIISKVYSNLRWKGIFVNSALKIQRHIVKNTLLQTAFSAILSTLYVIILYFAL